MKESIHQLLVHVDGSSQTGPRLQVAHAIAQAQGAAVTAMYAAAPAMLEVAYGMEAGAGLAASLREVDDQRRNAAREAFRRVQAGGAPAAAWAESQDYPLIPAFARQALYADLLVMGQHDAANPSPGVPFDFVEAVLAESGKPAIVVPYQGSPAIGQIVMVAWKPTREAARAVAAAVPILQRARKVHVLTWGEEDETVTGERLGLERYLGQRGIEPAWHREGGAEPAFLGELLLSRAFDLDADLLVMGCYGHSRAREWVLGGTSRTVLRSMTLPVLMAH